MLIRKTKIMASVFFKWATFSRDGCTHLISSFKPITKIVSILNSKYEQSDLMLPKLPKCTVCNFCVPGHALLSKGGSEFLFIKVQYIQWENSAVQIFAQVKRCS